MDSPGAVWAAGAAAVALLVVLVVAVIRTSDSSGDPGVGVPAPAPESSELSASRYTTASTTTSYRVPSVQTSQDGGAPGPTDVPTTDVSATDEPAPPSTPSTSTTTSNPYGTTTPTNAGHV